MQRVTSRYRGQAQRYIRPRYAPPGAEPRRGERVRPFKARQRTAEQLNIEFLPNGNVQVPIYERIPGTNRIREKGKRVFKNPRDAVRGTIKAINSINDEGSALDSLLRQVTGLHFEIVEKWGTSNPEQRETYINLLEGYAGAIGERKRLSREDKKKAQERLGEAVTLLRDNKNSSAAAVKIIGVANDLVAQRNVFTHQKTFLPRRAIVVDELAGIYKERLEKYVYDMLARMDILRSSKLTQTDIERVLAGMRIEYAKIFEKHEEEVRGPAKEELVAAGKALRENNKQKAREHMRNFNRIIVRTISRRYDLNERMLNFVKLSAFPEHRKAVFNEQLEMLADNVSFWYATAIKKRTITKLSHRLRVFAEASRRDMPAGVTKLVNDASLAVDKHMPAIAEEKMRRAVELMSGSITQ